MGNSATKEQRPSFSPTHSRPGSYRPSHSPGPSSSLGSRPQDSSTLISPPRNRRESRVPNLSLTSDRNVSRDPDLAGMEDRKETRAEREARKREKERVARLAERERSMKEESVDGGFLVTQGVYVGPEDFNKQVVRQLMIERRVAPFWRGLNDYSSSWTEHQLVAAARGLPIPAADDIPPETQTQPSPTGSDQNLNSLTVPITSRSHSHGSDTSSNLSPSHPAFSLPSPSSPLSLPLSNSPLFRGRSKTLASLTTKHSGDMTPREMKLPKDPYAFGLLLEAYLYKDATECPICFLYYPPYLNRTRCCDQPICSECFVQIKRPDPHIPEHGDQPHTNQEDGEDQQLVSEPAACPFCVQPEFGITYSPPPLRRGLTYAGQVSLTGLHATSAMSSTSSLSSGGPTTSRQRRASVSANSSEVITTDRVRPDWAQKLANARAHAARRAAAATALHTAAYLMNQGDSRTVRRGFLRRTGGDSPSSGNHSPHITSLISRERHRSSNNNNHGSDEENTDEIQSGWGLAPPRSSSRRTRMDDLEEMMMMEAIRLSLASEEERRKKEEKEAKKEAKKKQKEAKKAEKAAKKSGIYSSSDNSFTRLAAPSSSNLERPRTEDLLSFMDGGENTSWKGKGVERTGDSGHPDSTPFSQMEDSEKISERPDRNRKRSISQPIPHHSLSNSSGVGPSKPSHLRQMSNASSSASSFVDSGPASSREEFKNTPRLSLDGSGIKIPISHPSSIHESISSGTPPGGGAGTEPMFNFQSLAAMIGDDEKAEESPSCEHFESRDQELIDHAEASSSSNSKAASNLEAVHPVTERNENLVSEVPPSVSVEVPSPTIPGLLQMEPPQIEPMGKQPAHVEIVDTATAGPAANRTA
ncbi:MAG: SNF1-interacting protein [Cirrosporium novae-zelandiae]|nr:MAG: SNF1-interacting protein [Cirrosporium novae-zelandiae]